MSSPTQPGGTAPGNRAEQLRADIDAGRTGDKVAYPDPAVAPLGADDEAAGVSQQDAPVAPAPRTTPTADRVSEARKGTPSGNPGTPSRTWIYIAAVAAVLTAMLLLGTLMPYEAP